jgi:acetyl esterase/lipase
MSVLPDRFELLTQSTHQIRAITFWDRPSLPVVKKIIIERPPASRSSRPITAWLFFSRSERELKFATDLILDFPGGGFVTMGPKHHEERIRRWAIQTGRPILSVDYGKAPERQ